jgi:hypothetical protein
MALGCAVALQPEQRLGGSGNQCLEHGPIYSYAYHFRASQSSYSTEALVITLRIPTTK